MRKQIVLAAMFLLIFASSSFAGVGIKLNGVTKGTVTDINFAGNVSFGSSGTFDGSTLSFPIVLAGTANGGSTTMADTDTAVSTSYALVRKAISSTVGLIGTLANGTPGQFLTINITARASSGTFILQPTTKTGFYQLTFDAIGDQVTLLYVSDTIGWIIIGNVSVTVGPL